MTNNKNSTRYHSGKQEKQIAKTLKGKQTCNSGAGHFTGGDIQTNLFSIECKTSMTEKQSIAIKKQWLDKIKEEAFSTNKPYYALAFNYGLNNNENFYIINEALFKQLLTYLEEDN